MEEGQAASGMGGGRATEEAMAAMEEAKAEEAKAKAEEAAAEVAQAARGSVGSRSRRSDDTGPESVSQRNPRGTTSSYPVGEEVAPPRQAPSAEACRAKSESFGSGRERKARARGEGELRA